MSPELMAEKATVVEGLLKMMANRNRLMILCSLLEQERSVSELNEIVPLSQSALSQHLSALRQAELVSTRRQAQTIYYSVASDNVRAVLDTLYQRFCQE
ncbi:metalloregulator ArsR/SmtB family transcription factor [Psychrobium sp. MM17-31]|uniref:ArsR/SmtB family transcription factor n=1 Tax=Psychrobium sp. MM17-31 TaxID=2917758 RepID=UPI001EF3E942|nr:metalloregulator ArsR/SmtB family transcription factor [Psychrobium sp. MM17-31]MCG7531617.1 metalloregulator ArsR/SmtB family transcription factor [Psychrobium sp. MM17-31]